MSCWRKIPRTPCKVDNKSDEGSKGRSIQTLVDFAEGSHSKVDENLLKSLGSDIPSYLDGKEKVCSPSNVGDPPGYATLEPTNLLTPTPVIHPSNMEDIERPSDVSASVGSGSDEFLVSIADAMM